MNQWVSTACTLHESRNYVLYLSEILYPIFYDDDDYKEGRGEEEEGEKV